MASGKPLIAVTGATGAQGGSVVRFLLQDGGFRVRGITRKVDSPKAKELAAKGVEIVQADYEDPASLKRAFDGAHGVFGVTNFWETKSAEKETAQGKALVDAAKAVGVKHFVWSTLEHTSDPVCEHANSKAKVDDHLKESGVPRTSLYTVSYYENYTHGMFFPLKKTEDGKLLADWPMLWSDGPIGGYSVAETGAYVLEAFKKPDVWIGKDINIISDIFTPRDVHKALEESLGKPIVFKEVDRAAFEAAKSYSVEVWNNMEWFYKSKGNPGRDFELTKKIYPQGTTLAEFVRANKGAIPFPQ